jgi:glycosyltransferase involved in cell wall biosynthesis
MPIKILYTSSSATLAGGGQKSLLLLLTHISRTRFSPFLLCPGEGDLAAAARDLQVPVVILPIPSVSRLSVIALVKLYRIIKQEQIDLIHTDGPRSTFYLGIAARFTFTPVIWHVRVSTPEPYFYERFLYALSTRIIAVSQAAAQRFVCIPANGKKVKLIYNAVAFDTFSDFNKAFSADSLALPRVGIAGRIEPIKGIENFLQAVSIVHKDFPQARFDIAGDGDASFLSQINQTVEALGIKDALNFSGFQHDIKAYLSGLSILVNASNFGEGLSRIIIEAMAMGKPVIATNDGGNKEAVFDGINGFIVPKDDAKTLAKAIGKLLSDTSLAHRMGQEGRKMVEERFDIKKQIAAIESLYTEISLKKKEHDQ